MQFTKMHGIGNDYVFVDCFTETVNHPESLAIQISDRHFGVGSDGLILMGPSDRADVRMRMFNADGSESEMCGNGIRCVAKWAYGKKLAQPHPPSQPVSKEILTRLVPDASQYVELTVETLAGLLPVTLAIKDQRVEQLCVDMGQPVLFPGDIGVKVTGQQVVGVPMTIDGQHFLLTAVSMGNPHAVFYCEEVAKIHLEHIGPLLENHQWFPQRINVHFVQRLSDNEVMMRTWERGSGITLACGTGASAVCVAGVLASKTGHEILAHLPGGDLTLRWDPDDKHVYMAGPATEAFTGHWPLNQPRP